MYMLRFLSGFFWVAGLVWFIPSAWSFRASGN
jgi:hypothetical protein